MRIAVLTGGGDCPGLNAVIRAVVRRAQNHRFEVVGLRDGWKGLLEDRVFPLTRENTAGILHRGGTILGTCRPMTSTTMTRLCDSAVLWSRSIASVAMDTAVSKPKV